jgi:aminotransferase EvaB
VNALILGNSRFVRKRVLTPLSSVPGITSIDVASRHSVPGDFAGVPRVERCFNDYELALDQAERGIAYISLPNSLHAYWIERALHRGWHVIVDKPSCLDLASAEELMKMARDSGRCLAEANIWADHPAVAKVHKMFEEAGDRPKRVMATFVFPRLPSGDFRYKPELGGGAVNDLGPYAVTSWLEWLRGCPDFLNCRVTDRSAETGVDSAFSVLATGNGARSLIGQFGFNGEYTNTITVAGEELRVELDRVFTLTPSCQAVIRARARDKESIVKVEAADTMDVFLRRVLAAIRSHDYAEIERGVLERAQFQDALTQLAARGEAALLSPPRPKPIRQAHATIPVWECVQEYEAERSEILAVVDGVFRSGRLILGPNVEKFEEEFAAYCGVEFGVGVDNATNGLFLALKALGIGAGDEVITVSNTAVPTVSAIVAAGAAPRFVDIERGTYLMDVSRIEQALTSRTRCILPVHLFGQMVDMKAVNDFARAHGLFVIEDCSQSHGAALDGRKAGAWSDLSVYSFYPTKPLGAYGDGGMVLTGDIKLRDKLRRLRFYGMDKTYCAEEDGYNSRLDEVQAAILRAKMKRLDHYIDRRQHLARRYETKLAKTSLQLPLTASGRRHVFYIYVCRHPQRERIIRGLAERNITVNISYPWPIHTMRAYARLGYNEGDLPETEAAAREIFSLPMFPHLSEFDQDRVCEAMKDILASSLTPTTAAVTVA